MKIEMSTEVSPSIETAGETADQAKYRILSIPLITERWQEDRLQARMNLCHSLYNAELAEAERHLKEMRADPREQQFRSVIREVYAMPAEERAAAKATPVYREAVQIQGELYRTYGFSSYSFCNRAIELAKPYREILPSRVAHFTVGLPLWTMFHQVLIGRRNSLAYKKQGQLRDLRSDGRSGIRLIDDRGRGHREGICLTSGENDGEDMASIAQYYVLFGKRTGRRVLQLPLKIDPDDRYMREALHNPMRTISIVAKPDGKRTHYYACLTIQLEDDPDKKEMR